MPLAFSRSILAGGVAEPTYAITTTSGTINEGNSVTFTMSTENVDQGTNIPYTITGVSSADISGASLNGNFNIGADGSANVLITLANDQLTEGTETLVLTSQDISVSVSVQDTSKAVQYQSVVFTPNSGFYDEGDTVDLTMRVYNSNETLYWKSSYYYNGAYNESSADLSPSSGAFVKNPPGPINDGALGYYYNHTASFTITEDLTTEGSETHYISRHKYSPYNTQVGGYQSFGVYDTSTTPITEIPFGTDTYSIYTGSILTFKFTSLIQGILGDNILKVLSAFPQDSSQQNLRTIGIVQLSDGTFIRMNRYYPSGYGNDGYTPPGSAHRAYGVEFGLARGTSSNQYAKRSGNDIVCSGWGNHPNFYIGATASGGNDGPSFRTSSQNLGANGLGLAVTGFEGTTGLVWNASNPFTGGSYTNVPFPPSSTVAL